MTKEQLGDLIVSSEKQLYSTAKTILYNDQDCADAIQETIIKSFSKIHTLRNEKYAKTWLIRILINECYTILRKTSRQIPLEELPDAVQTPSEEFTDFDEVHQAILSLKEELRLPIILYYFDDFSIREIAQLLKVSEGTIQKRLVRARNKLRNHLQESEACI